MSKSTDVTDALSPRSTLNHLHFATRARQYHAADLLLHHDADVNAWDSKGRTALMEPCHGGPWELEPDEGIIQLLLSHDAEIELRADSGFAVPNMYEVCE